MVSSSNQMGCGFASPPSSHIPDSPVQFPMCLPATSFQRVLYPARTIHSQGPYHALSLPSATLRSALVQTITARHRLSLYLPCHRSLDLIGRATHKVVRCIWVSELSDMEKD